MGLEIGFNLYEKKPLDEEDKYVLASVEPECSYVCGRTDTTYSWSTYFTFNQKDTITPVFQEALKDKVEKLDDFSQKYKLISFEDFKEPIMSAIKEVIEDKDTSKLNIRKTIFKYKNEINELRELQQKCTEDNEFAFDKWEEQIQNLKTDISELEDSYDTYEEEDYDYSHAIAVKELLEEMEKYLKEDRYYVIPFYSY